MPTKRYSMEQIVSKLRQVEVELSRDRQQRSAAGEGRTGGVFPAAWRPGGLPRDGTGNGVLEVRPVAADVPGFEVRAAANTEGGTRQSSARTADSRRRCQVVGRQKPPDLTRRERLSGGERGATTAVDGTHLYVLRGRVVRFSAAPEGPRVFWLAVRPKGRGDYCESCCHGTHGRRD